MLSELPTSLDPPTVKMLAIIEQWGGDSCHRDNTSLYLLLVFVKAGLDAVILYLCWRKLYTSFISLCSLSVFLADMVMMFFLVNVYFLGATRSPVSLCFLLAYASAAYAALPLPMLAFGLLDYILADECISNQRAIYKTLRNIFLTVLMWTFAILYSSESAVTEMTQLEYLGGTTALVCEVQESMLILYFVLGLFIAIFATLLPFWSKILRWLREAERLSHQREECQEYQRSDLLLTFSRYETKSGEFVQESMRPPLWVSLTLCFSSVWIPYFIISMACLIFGFGVPAYLTINLLWLECTNSVMVGVLFWVKSKTQGPYSQIPENMCLWSVYWHLSKGTQMQQLPTAVFNPSKERETHCAI